MTAPGGQLADKVIVVIGGTSGIGLAAAQACHAEGASIVTIGLQAHDGESDLQQQIGDLCRIRFADALDPGTADAAIADARAAFGGFDGLVHVAGGSGRQWGDGPIGEITREGWQRTLELNLSTVFLSNRAAIRAFQEKKSGGAIVNLASVLGFTSAPKHFASHAYATAKGGIVALTRSAAAYYAKDNIRINAVAPGLTDTPMAERAKSDPAIQAYVKAKQPLDGGRMATPNDIAGAIVFLLSDAARFVTGQVLAVDGGWSVSEA